MMAVRRTMVLCSPIIGRLCSVESVCAISRLHSARLHHGIRRNTSCRGISQTACNTAKRKARDDTVRSGFSADEIVTNFDLFKSHDNTSSHSSSTSDHFKSNRIVFLEGDVHPASLPVDQLLQDCEIQRTKRGGPGGQHRNKTCTTVVITHKKTRVSAEGHERRNQLMNMKVGIQRLRCQLACKVRTMGDPTLTGKTATTWEPSKLLLQRCAPNGKIILSGTHDDYPAVLANVLDGIFWARFEVTKAESPMVEKINECRRAFAADDVLIDRAPPMHVGTNTSDVDTKVPQDNAVANVRENSNDEKENVGSQLTQQETPRGISDNVNTIDTADAPVAPEALPDSEIPSTDEGTIEKRVIRYITDSFRPVKANEIINLLFKYPAAIQLVNLEREHLGMFRLRKRT